MLCVVLCLYLIAAKYRLEKIILNKNPITKISYPHNHNTTDQSPEKEGSEVPFANLHSLSLDYIQIATWQDIEDLNVFPNLTELRLRYTPLYDATSSSVARMIAVSRFPRITILNGSHVHPFPLPLTRSPLFLPFPPPPSSTTFPYMSCFLDKRKRTRRRRKVLRQASCGVLLSR